MTEHNESGVPPIPFGPNEVPAGYVGWIECLPSYDLRAEPPKPNYGIANMRIVFYLAGPLGVVQWVIGTDWGIAPVREHLNSLGWSKWDDPRQPKAWDLGRHSPRPMYEGEEPMSGHCKITGGACYYDGTTLGARELTEGFLAGGTRWLWPKLAQVYESWFNNAKWPGFEPEYRAASERAEEKLNGAN